VTSVATQFLTHVLINFQKNPKIAKNNENPKKYFFLYIREQERKKIKIKCLLRFWGALQVTIGREGKRRRS
jgi:hypothetical protein